MSSLIIFFLPANYLLCDLSTAVLQHSHIREFPEFILCFWMTNRQRAPIKSEHNFVIPPPSVHGSRAVNAKEEPLRLGDCSPNPHSPLMPSGLLWVWIKFGCPVPSLTEPSSPPCHRHTQKKKNSTAEFEGLIAVDEGSSLAQCYIGTIGTQEKLVPANDQGLE